jgi:hemerythrin-like domain-containing protein
MNERVTFELRDEHEKIRSYFNEIDIVQDHEKRKQLVQELKELVVMHVGKEDAFLYPALQRSGNEEIVNLGNTFLNSMVGYSAVFMEVTERILQCDGEFGPELRVDYEKMRDKIKNRIFVEEVALFPAYEKVV